MSPFPSHKGFSQTLSCQDACSTYKGHWDRASVGAYPLPCGRTLLSGEGNQNSVDSMDILLLESCLHQNDCLPLTICLCHWIFIFFAFYSLFVLQKNAHRLALFFANFVYSYLILISWQQGNRNRTHKRFGKRPSSVCGEVFRMQLAMSLFQFICRIQLSLFFCITCWTAESLSYAWRKYACDYLS